MEEVIVTIGQDGSAQVKAQCVKGKACKDVTKAIEAALGKTTADTPTSEMYEASHVQARR